MTGYLILSIFFGCLSQIFCAPTWVSIMLIIASGACTGMAIMEEAKLRVRVEVLERMFHAWTIEHAKEKEQKAKQSDETMVG